MDVRLGHRLCALLYANQRTRLEMCAISVRVDTGRYTACCDCSRDVERFADGEWFDEGVIIARQGATGLW
jgi:hypothetical protein